MQLDDSPIQERVKIETDDAIAILAEVFMAAIEDLQSTSPSPEVIRWFISDELYICSFIYLCQVFNFSPCRIRQYYKVIIYRDFIKLKSEESKSIKVI
jgi:hypothetical protein